MNTHFNNPVSQFMNALDLQGLKHPDSHNEPRVAFGVTSSSTQKTSELLENELARGLPGFKPLTHARAADFSPPAVADRILGFVETSIQQRAGSEIEAQSMLQEAREGIAQGFAEAREILGAMSQMTDKIETQVNETEELIFKGLDDFHRAPLDTPSQQKVGQLIQIGQLISESASQSSQFKQSSQASIEIVTQEGDKVEVSYSAFIQAASNKSYSQNQQGFSTSAEFSSSSEVAFQFNVQGDLDADEQQAINKLLNEVGDLAGQFFNGDVQAAFNASMELGFDSSELKSFALDLQQSSTVAVVQTYQRTEQINKPVASLVDLKPVNHGPGPAINMLAQLEQLMEQTKENALIEQPENTIKAMLSDMMALLNEGSDLPAKNYIDEIIQSA